MIWALILMMLLPASAQAQELQQSAQALVDGLQLDVLAQAADQTGLFSQSVPELLKRLCAGEMILSPGTVLERLLQLLSGLFGQSAARMTRLMIPAVLACCPQWLKDGSASRTAGYAGMLMTLGVLAYDLRDHAALCTQTIGCMTDWMQALFPLMTTLLAAVGGTAGSAFYQPAVMAAAGSMTALIQQATMPLMLCTAILTMADGLSEHLRVTRMCRLFRQAACWTLGLGFTVFLGVMSVQGMTAAALDGVSIRTAKYAMNHFIPIVGGMFADTVDTLVGCSLVVHNALGVLGVFLLLGALLLPLLRTMLTLFLYRAAAALLELLSGGPLCRAVSGYADVFSLLFVIQLSVGTMFFLLTAQLILTANWTVMLR